MRKSYFSLIILLVFSYPLLSQSAGCDQSHSQIGYTCDNTQILCALDTPVVSSTLGVPPSAPLVFCGGSATSEGNYFYSFRAADDIVIIDFIVFNCGNDQGIQAALFAMGSDCRNLIELACFNPGGAGDQNFTLEADVLPGKSYILMIDGYAGDICDYEMTYSGVATQDTMFSVETPGILGPEELCFVSSEQFTIANPQPGIIYSWFVNGNYVKSGETLNWTFVDMGVHEICVKAESACEIACSCINVQIGTDLVLSLPDSITICTYDYPFALQKLDFDMLIPNGSISFHPTYDMANNDENPIDTIDNTDTVVWLRIEDEIDCIQIDSIYFMDSTVVEEAIDTAICQGDQFVLGSQTFDQEGNYEVMLTSANGCDSIVSLDLDILPLLEVDVEESICEGESYNFNGNILTEGGTYLDTLPRVQGCDSVIVLTLDVIQPVSVNVTDSICEGDRYNFNGNTLTTPGTYSDTLISQVGCDSIVNLTLDYTDELTEYIADTICQGQVYDFNQFLITSSGTYESNLTSVNGCDSAAILTLEVLPPAIINMSETLCAGETFTFNGQVLNDSGVYTDTLVGSNGCDSIRNLDLTILDPIEVVTSVIKDDDGTGSGSISPVIQGGSPPYMYWWSNGETTQSIYNLNANTYGVQVTDTEGCTQYFTFEVELMTDIASPNNLFDFKLLTNPIPAGSDITLQLSGKISGELSTQLYNIYGQAVTESLPVDPLKSQERVRINAPQEAGVYVLVLRRYEKVIGVRRVVVSR